MKINLVVLANSWKHGGRCVAGIRIEKTNGAWSIPQDDGKPTWIRPVSESDAGELPLTLVQGIKMLDVVEISEAKHSPCSFQTENYYFKDIKVICKFPPTESLFKNIIDSTHSTIFQNKGKAVHPDQIPNIDYSLMFIRPNKFESSERKNVHGDRQIRGTFEFNGVKYDFPITDPCFVLGSEKGKTVYITISLGVMFMGWHSKLIAGVFCI